MGKDTAAIRAAIDRIRAKFERAYAAGDFDTVAELVHPDIVYSGPGNSPIRGRDRVMAFDEQSFPSGATIDIAPMETHVINDEWVYEIGTSTVHPPARGDAESRSSKSTYLAIYRNTADGWKLYCDVASSDG